MLIKRPSGDVDRRSEKWAKKSQGNCPECGSATDMRISESMDFDEDGMFQWVTNSCRNTNCAAVTKDKLLQTKPSTRIF